MITMSVGEFKTHFSEVLEQVKAGEKIAVTEATCMTEYLRNRKMIVE